MRFSRTLTLAVAALVSAATALVLTSFPASASPPPETGPGSLDTGFGAGLGRVNFGNGFGGALDSVVVQPDGKIVAGIAAGSNSGITIYRLDANGTPDPTWGTQGAAYWANAGTPGDDPKAAIASDPQGRIYVTSALPGTGSDPDVAVLRLTSAGVPDPSFGTAGVFTRSFGTGINNHGTSLVVDPATGRIYVTVWQESPADFTVMALTSAGALDTGFSGDGIATTDFQLGIDTARDITLLPGGDIVVAGFVRTDGGSDDTGLWRLHPDGTPDTSFGQAESGQAEYDLGHGQNDGARSITSDGAGHLYVSGIGSDGESALGIVSAFTDQGALINNFNSRSGSPGGTVATHYGATSGNTSNNAAVTVDERGRPVVVGQAVTWPGVARLVNDRYPFDTTFGAGGEESLPCPNEGTAGASGVAMQADGKIVVVGQCPDTFGATFTVWRLNGGDSVPLPETPSADAGLTVDGTSISVNDQGRSVTVAPGSTLTLHFTFDLPATGDTNIDQITTGFVNPGPDQCYNMGVNTETPASGAVDQSFTAPTAPGRYYLAMNFAQFYACLGDPGPGASWESAGKPWSNDIEPNPSAYLAEVIVGGLTAPALASDGGTVPAGHHVTPVDNIPLDGLTGTLEDLQAAPLRGSPLRGSPLRGSPLRGSPLRGSPLRGSPLRGSPLRGSPLRGSPIPLSQVPLDPPNTWSTVLAGTAFANQPLQNVTLQDVLALDPAPAAVSGLSLADIDVSRTPLRNVSLVAFLLGNTPVANLGPLPTGVTDGTQSLVGLELAGTNLNAYYQAGIHVKGKTLVDAPLAGVRLGDMWLSQTPFGAVPTSAVPSSWYSCSLACATLADAQAANPDTGLTNAATVGALLALTNSPDVTVG
ncbi:MAG: hypothetical protein WCB04_03625, partial [Mycobacteriales bacterium]